MGAINSELSRSIDYATTSLKATRRRAWDYYLNRERGDELEGRSGVQDTSVRDTVHALMAAIMPSYASDHVIAYEPTGPNDIDQAKAESEAVNNLFTESNMGYLQLSNAVHDCLLFRNGIMKVHVEEKEEKVTRTFDAPVKDVLAQAPPDENWEFIGENDQGLNQFSGTVQVQTLITESIEPAYFYTDPNQQDQDLIDADFLSELVYFSRSELLAMGIKRSKVRDLPATPDKATSDGQGFSNTDITAKFVDGVTDIQHAATSDRDMIECYWVHIKIDRDGDGLSERWRFLISHSEFLLDDEVEFFPYCSGAAWPVPHRWSGLSVYDLLRITQDNRTNALRQLNDNLNVANNQRPVFDPGETKAEDVANGAPGRGIRSKNPQNVGWMPVQDIVSNSIAFLQYTDGIRAEQTGSTLDLQSPDNQTMASISGVSAEMQLAPRELMAQHISRNIAETLVRNLFVLIHRTLRTQWNAPIMYVKSGDWQETNPAQWQPRIRLNVSVGLSPGERRRMQQALQYVHQMQLQLIQGGMANITTNLNGFHKSLTDWMKSVELPSHEGYFLDPEGQESQQGQQAAQQQQQQQAQQQQQEQEKQNQMLQFEAQIEQMKVQIDKQEADQDQTQADNELRFKYWDSLLDANLEGEKLDVDIAEQAESNRLERTKIAAGQNGTGESDAG